MQVFRNIFSSQDAFILKNSSQMSERYTEIKNIPVSGIKNRHPNRFIAVPIKRTSLIKPDIEQKGKSTDKTFLYIRFRPSLHTRQRIICRNTLQPSLLSGSNAVFCRVTVKTQLNALSAGERRFEFAFYFRKSRLCNFKFAFIREIVRH